MTQVCYDVEGDYAMTDTCCAKTVAGEEWAQRQMRCLWEKGVEFGVVRESQPFRFGPGKRIHSNYALIFPMAVGPSEHICLVRVSVVPQKVPLLLSKKALVDLGACMYLAEGRVELEALKATVDLVTTQNDQVAIKINVFEEMHLQVKQSNILDAIGQGDEVTMLTRTRVKGLSGEPLKQKPQEPSRRSPGKPTNKPVKKVHVCASPAQSFPVVTASTDSVACHASSVPPCASSEEGLRRSHSGPLQCVDGRAGQARHAEAERDLGCVETQSSSASVGTGVEEGHPRHPARDLRGDGCTRSGTRSQRQTSPRVEAGPVPARDRPLGGGEAGGPPWRRRLFAPDTSMCNLHDPNDPAHQPSLEGGLLRVHAVSSVQGVPAPDVCRPADCGDASCHEAKDCQGDRGGRRDVEQEQAQRHDRGRESGWIGKLRRFLGGAQRCSGDGASDQRECDRSRDGEDPQRQAVRVQDEVRDFHESRIDSPSVKPVLSESEIRNQIRRGNIRRKHMKKGMGRRLLGNAKQILSGCFMVCAVACAAVAETGSSFLSMASQRPDILEVFGGHAEVSLRFSQWGWRALEPCDIKYGSDLRDPQARAHILRTIREHRPRLVVVEYPCTRWSPLTNLTYRTSQERRRLRKLQQAERPFLDLTENIFDIQIENGDEALGENPLGSYSFNEKPIERICNHPEVHVGVGHGCRYGVRHRRSGLLLKKPTLWFSTSREIIEELSKRCKNMTCPGDHVHGMCMGGKDVTEHAGRYTPEIAKAIHKGFVRTLKRKEPSRIRQVLVSVQRRLNRNQGSPTDLRWCKRDLNKHLQQWHAAFPVERSDAPEDSGRIVEGATQHLSEEGISFQIPAGRKLDASDKHLLRKLHCNLGHPHPNDMERFLRLGGVKQHLVEACKWLQCMTCEHGRRPQTHRTASIPPCQIRFGDEICMDCFHIHDSKQQGFWFLSMLDRATSFHLVTLLDDHSPESLSKTFNESWCRWAGNPSRISVDMEGGFRGEGFWKAVGDGCIPVVPIAGTAHWQAGKVERHGQTLKRMMENVIRHTNVHGKEDMIKMAQEACQAKNELVREHGWSPNMLVFGREPRVHGEIHIEGNPVVYHPDVGLRGSDVGKHIRFRYHARMSYIRHQAKKMILQSVEQRTRTGGPPEQGKMVFFWRETKTRRKQEPASNWVGPGFVVGVQGNNVWIACGGRCYLVASEHVRLAMGDEHYFGIPEIQESIAMFKRSSPDATFEDLTKQTGPTPKDMSIDEVDVDLVEDINDDEGLPTKPDGVDTGDRGNWLIADKLTGHMKTLNNLDPGWHVDRFGDHVRIDYKAIAFKTPDPGEGGSVGRFRTTWGFIKQDDGSSRWCRIEKEVEWTEMSNPNQLLPEIPVHKLITIFSNRKRKDGVEKVEGTSGSKRARTGKVYEVHAVSKQKQKRMLDKEIPFSQIPSHETALYQAAEEKEWNAWKQYGTVEELSREESDRVRKECPSQVLRSRMVYRNKHAGLVDHLGKPLETKAKARLCVLGQHAPGVAEALTPVDSPTVQRITTFFFLHCVVSWNWLSSWRVGDVSNAFLQGDIPKGQKLYMEQPIRGLPSVEPGILFRLQKSVYGLPEAPRMWYESLCRILVDELHFEKSCLDPALFFLRNSHGKIICLLATHVDDIMVAGNGSVEAEGAIENLHKRLPFGEWKYVEKEEHGVTYCGKELLVRNDPEGKVIVVRQKGFTEGRLEKIPITRERQKELDSEATPEEITDFRSTVGSLQWLATQSQPSISFEVNQLQKRVPKLLVRDLVWANRVVQDVKRNPNEIILRNLGAKWSLVVFHDAALFNSVGVEIDEQDADDLLLSGSAKRLVYSQKGCIVGFVAREDVNSEGKMCSFNLLDWKSSTNKRVIESSFSAETQAALLGHGQAHFCQNLVIEAEIGKEGMLQADMVMQQEVQPMVMVTDCKSIFDTVHKQSKQHISDKGAVVSVVLLRQVCDTQSSPGRSLLLWVPSEYQLADGLTKPSRNGLLRDNLWKVKLHEKALRRATSKGKSASYSQERSDSNVNTVCFAFDCKLSD